MTPKAPAGGEPFLSRWSRRKQAAKAQEPEAVPPPPPPEQPSAPAPPPPDLPPVESLGKESDYSAFLKDGVPRELKQAALQRLWQSDPALMAPEIMDLHMGDYATPAGEVVRTAWRLGKGVLDAAELAAEQDAEQAAEQDEQAKADQPPADKDGTA